MLFLCSLCCNKLLLFLEYKIDHPRVTFIWSNIYEAWYFYFPLIVNFILSLCLYIFLITWWMTINAYLITDFTIIYLGHLLSLQYVALDVAILQSFLWFLVIHAHWKFLMLPQFMITHHWRGQLLFLFCFWLF